MTAIQPISTSRVTDAMTRGRLTAQIQNDQLDLFRLQNQLSTGLRIFLPSDDASSAQRAMVLQRTIERKDQSVTNLQGARASLATTEGSLAGVSDNLNSLKSQALAVVDSIANEEQKQAVIESINGALFELTRVGNATFASNYLLGGAERSSQAYSQAESYIEYLGDESSPQTFVDIGQLFDQGLSGSDVFGGISAAVRGSSDLNAQLTPETKLSRLNAGAGANTDGAIEITYVPSTTSEPTVTAVIDLSQAETISDVTRLIEAGAPEGSGVVVSIEGSSLRLDTADGGITVGEVSSGRVARGLGLLREDTPAATVRSGDLNPTLRGTTRLDDLLGAKARGRIVPGGDNNDLRITAKANGAGLNDLAVVFQGGANAGSESAAYDSVSNTLTVTIDDGESTAAQVAAAINANDGVPVTAAIDSPDQTSAAARGTGLVAVPTPPETNLVVGVAGGAEGSLDVASGFVVKNGDKSYDIDISGAETVEDVLGILNDPEYGLFAAVNAAGDGIDVRTRRSGADFTIGENGGTTATQLGIRTYTEDSRLADFNRGVGVLVEGENPADTLIQNEFVISVTEDGVVQSYQIDPREAKTVADLIGQIAADTNGLVNASLPTEGNGLVLTVTDPDSPETIAQGTVAVPTDTLGFSETFTIAATTGGDSGNRPGLTLAIAGASGTGGLSTSVTGDAIVVDLGGTTPTTAAIAASIEGQLPGYRVTVSGDGADTVSADLVATGAAVTGGAPPSAAAVTSSGGFALNGDDLTFTADATGPEGNRPFSVEFIDDGVGGLASSIDGDAITVNLGGADSTTDAIAASIETAINDARNATLETAPEAGPSFTVRSSGNATVASLATPSNAAATGGQDADPGADSQGTVALGSDQLTITAATPGVAGDRGFTLEITGASGAGGLTTTVVGDAITVNLGGTTPTTDQIALSIQNELAGFTVASNGFDTISADAGSVSAATTGGIDPSPPAVSSGSITLAGDTIDFTADATGPGGDRPFTVSLRDSGAGGLVTSIDGDAITIDLGGAGSPTSTIAASIQTAINDARDAALLAGDPVGPSFTVQSSGTATVSIGPPSDGTTTGGRAIDSITVSGEYAQRLGFDFAGEESVTVEDGTLASGDRNTREVDSVFTTLIRMREALLASDQEGFSREVQRLEDDIDRVSFARAEVGVRLQNLDAVSDRLADEEVTLREALSNEIDADLVEVISEFTAKQAALQASLQTSGALLNLSILDFI